MTALDNLLRLIRQYEGGPGVKGYGTVYSGSPVKADVSRMTLKRVQEFQNKMLAAGSRSTACGGYQFIKGTLANTIKAMKLSGNEVWTPELQDRMALHLLTMRGFQKFMNGTLSREDFANNLAKEWASLPVVTYINGKRPGQSYYAGDGLNSAHHKPVEVLAAIDALKKAGGTLPTNPITPPAQSPEVRKPRGLVSAILALLKYLFSLRKGK